MVADSDQSEYFVHQRAILSDGWRTLLAGQAVEFDVEPGKDGKGPMAVNVVPLPEEVAVAAD